MTPARPKLHDKVLRNLAARGAAGARWREALPSLIARLEREWGMAAGAAFSNATEAYVVEAVLADGTPAALKVPIPGIAKGDRERRLLEAADGQGYVRLLRHDPESGAMLIERLGEQLAQSGLGPEAQIEVIAAALAEAWRRPAHGLDLPTGAEKAAGMASYVERMMRAPGNPVAPHTARVAQRFLGAREAAFDPATSVLGHGDAHAWNTLRVPGTDRYKFVDPDGFFIERAHDLSISLREGVNDFLAGDPVALGRARCAFVSRLTGVEAEAIWQWGLIECLVNGLTYLEVGSPQHAAPFLAVAEAWAAAE